ncbi:lipoprotein signal peptidase [Alcaligenes faecalis subsp. faecalis NCIB 8687]|nr:lipoprotein signal peptidase [Alcaligenes faecalis subsp. faecalis NCIB 8687]
MRGRPTGLPTCFLILGGAVGNVVDRLMHGHVVDFLLFYWNQSYFPVKKQEIHNVTMHQTPPAPARADRQAAQQRPLAGGHQLSGNRKIRRPAPFNGTLLRIRRCQPQLPVCIGHALAHAQPACGRSYFSDADRRRQRARSCPEPDGT